MRRYAVVLAAVVLTIGASAVAIAAIPDSNGIIHACRDTKSGNLRVIDTDTGQACSSKEDALNWNQAGPAPQTPTVRVHTGGFQTSGDASVDIYCPTPTTAVSISFDQSGLPLPTTSIYAQPLVDDNGTIRPVRDENGTTADGLRPVGYRVTSPNSFNSNYYISCMG
jgi:hypothetical protein